MTDKDFDNASMEIDQYCVITILMIMIYLVKLWLKITMMMIVTLNLSN